MRVESWCIPLCALLAACTAPASAMQPSAAPATLAHEIPAYCSVTLPPEQPFTPPKPWPAAPPDADRFWYGDDGLWTALPKTGRWGQLARGDKFWWWSAEFDVNEEPAPELMIQAVSIPANKYEYPPFKVTVDHATNGYHPSFNWAMLVGLQLPPACWEVHALYKGHEVSFVLWVAQDADFFID